MQKFRIMIRIEKFRFEDKEKIKISNEIRTKVFIEEQHVDPEIEYEFEEEGNYYLLYYKMRSQLLQLGGGKRKKGSNWSVLPC